MSKPKLRGVLLCEDKEHELFFRSLLRKWFGDSKQRRFHVQRIPNKQGAAEAWVLERYAQEVQIARRKRGENYALVVAIDGDRFKLKERLRQLDQRLADESPPRRGQAERIAVFAPTRSIETWELWLCGDRELDEAGDFKRRFHQARDRGEVSAKDAVASWFRPLSSEQEAIEQKTLPSLAAGRAEIERLDRSGG